MRRRPLCAVLLLLALLGTAPASASGSCETDAPRGAFAALWDRVAASLAQLWGGLVFDAAQGEEPADPASTSTPPSDPEPQGDFGGTLDPNG